MIAYDSLLPKRVAYMFDHSALKRTMNSDSNLAKFVFERLTGHPCQHCFSLDRPFALGSDSSLSLLFESRNLTSSVVSDIRSQTCMQIASRMRVLKKFSFIGRI